MPPSTLVCTVIKVRVGCLYLLAQQNTFPMMHYIYKVNEKEIHDFRQKFLMNFQQLKRDQTNLPAAICMIAHICSSREKVCLLYLIPRSSTA